MSHTLPGMTSSEWQAKIQKANRMSPDGSVIFCWYMVFDSVATRSLFTDQTLHKIHETLVIFAVNNLRYLQSSFICQHCGLDLYKCRTADKFHSCNLRRYTNLSIKMVKVGFVVNKFIYMYNKVLKLKSAKRFWSNQFISNISSENIFYLQKYIRKVLRRISGRNLWVSHKYKIDFGGK